MASEVKIQLVQFAPKLADISDGIEKHRSYVEVAILNNIDVVVFPELSLSGYLLKDSVRDVALNVDEPKLDAIYLKRNPTLIFGSVEKRDRKTFFNSAFCFTPTRRFVAHQKNKLPNYGMFEEARFFLNGSGFTPFFLENLGIVGILICEDAWYLDSVVELVSKGSQIIFVLANSPYREKIIQTWYGLLKFYAIEFAVYIVFVNRVGSEDGHCFWGGSVIFDRYGQILKQADFFREDSIGVSLHVDSALKKTALNRIDEKSKRIMQKKVSRMVDAFLV